MGRQGGVAVIYRAIAVALLCVAAVGGHFSDSFWASIPTGTTVVYDGGSTPPVCAGNSSTNCHRVLAATKNIGSEIGKITKFLGTLNGGSVNFGAIGDNLKSLDFKVLSPKVLAVQTSSEDDLDAQLDANEAAVNAVTANLQNLPGVLDRAVRVSRLKTALSSISDAWGSMAADLTRGCGVYKGVFQQRIAELASTDFSFENDTDHAVMKPVVVIIVKGMAALTTMRQRCDIYGAIDPSVDVKLVYDVLIKATTQLQQDAAALKQAKDEVEANKGSFVDGSTAFKNQMTDLLTAKNDLNQGAADVLNSDAWRMAVNGNSAAADASRQLTAGILTQHNEFSGKLTGLENEINTTANARLAAISKVDGKIDEMHGKKMAKMDTMASTFSDQHDARMDRLTGIDNKVVSITGKAKQGFTQIQGKLTTLQDNLVRVIDGVANIVKDDAALTTRELKEALAGAFKETQNRIGNIDSKIDGQAAAVQDTLFTTKQILKENYDETNAVLSSASQQMSALVATSFEVIKNTVVNVAQQTQDVISSRVIANGQRLSEQFVEFEKKVEYIDGRLEVLADQVATLEDKLQVTNAILQDLAATAELVAVGVEDLISEIKEIFFQRTFEDLTARYSSLRGAYTYVLANAGDSEALSSLKLSCQQAQANDLFLSLINLVDIEDEQIPKQLEAFQSNPTKYQLFGVQVLTLLDEASMLATLCSGLLFRDEMTEDDLRRKTSEYARMIREAARKFTRHIDEVVPAYMIRQPLRNELQKSSTMELGSDATTRARNLAAVQKRMQDLVGAFARVTVIVAPRGGVLSVNHLEEQYPDVDLSNVRRYGMMVSANKAMAVFWGTTKQLPATEKLEQQSLLRQGIYRGSIKAPTGCTVAQDAAYYPRCASCVCDHYEDFASSTLAAAGRVVTVLNSTAIDSDFSISTVFDAHVDYFMESLRLDIALDSPTIATVKADIVTPQRQTLPRVLWEGYSSNGKFHVVPGDVKGTLLAANELTFTLSPSGTSGALRRVEPLFCNGKSQIVQYNTTATLTYACRELPRKSLDDGTDAVVMRGLSQGRLDAAVCIEKGSSSATKLDCRVTGGFDAITGDVTALHIGKFVRDVTLYSAGARKGDFAMCKGCSAEELLKQLTSVGSIALESPDEQLLPYMAAVCDKTSDTVLACKT